MCSREYYHWVFGENNCRPDKPTYLINLEYGISIRFDYDEAYMADFESFFENIADIQFLTGNRPQSESKLNEIYIEAWNFLCEEERILDEFENHQL